MVNKNLFKGKVYSVGDNLYKAAKAIGCSQDNLSKKLNGKSNFTVDQIKMFVEHYKCTPDETVRIFFDD